MQDNKVYVPHSDTRDILAGALLGRLLSVVAPIVAGPLVLYPANVSIVLLAVLGAIQRLQPKLDWPWRVIMGISLDGVVFLIIRDTYGYYSNPAIVGALVLLLIYIALAPLREKATHVWRKGDQRHYFRVWTSLGTAAFIIVWMRVTYLAVMDIPNAERSFFIAGHQFAVCARCTGIYAGFTLATIVYPLVRSLRQVEAPPRKWLFLAATPLAIDFTVGFLGIWQNTHTSRFATGALLGAVAVFYVMPGLMDLSLRNWHSSGETAATKTLNKVPSLELFATNATAAPSDYSAPDRRI